MSVIISNSQVRDISLGRKVDRAAATLPQTATGALFTVTGGRIIVTSLTGEVTVALGATATTAAITSTPTVGSAVTVATATAITSKQVGSLITLAGTVGTALNVQDAGAGTVTNAGVVIPIGTIGLTTNANDTGSVKWSLTYIPLDNAATVVAA